MEQSFAMKASYGGSGRERQPWAVAAILPLQYNAPVSWMEPVDQYCERLDASFWAEPLNALSNASFIVAGVLLGLRWRRMQMNSPISLLLIVNVLSIGLGSFLFHTFANRWSMLADVLPITIFIYAYLLAALRAYVGVRLWLAVAIAVAAFAATPSIGGWLEPVVGSSSSYLPALAMIFAVGIAAQKNIPQAAGNLYAAGTVFAVSISFRTADQPFCASVPFGTHFMWHLLNGVVVYLLVSLYMTVEARRHSNAPQVPQALA
jgi:hypothetical protein